MIVAALVIVALLASSPSEGTMKLDQIRARGTLMVSVKNQGPSAPGAHKDPAHFQKRDFEIEIAERIARAVFADQKTPERPTKNLVDLRILPKAKRLPALMAGEVDLVISMIAVNDERKKQVDFSQPYYVGGLAIMTKHDSKASKISDLAGKRIAWAVQNANNPQAQLEEAWKARAINVELVRYPSFKLAAEALRDGKVEAMVSWNPNVEAFLETAPTGYKRLEELLTKEHYAIAVRKGDGDLLRLVDATLADMKSGGDLAKLAAKHKLVFPDDVD